MISGTVDSAEAVDTKNHVRDAVRAAWPDLPTLLVGSILFCAVAAFIIAMSPGVNVVSILLSSVLLVPIIGALAQTVQLTVAEGSAPSPLRLLRTLPRTWWLTMRECLALAVSSTLVFFAFGVWTQTSDPVWLFSLAASGTVSALSLLCTIVALPLRLRRPDLSARHLWLISLTVVVRDPVPIIGVVVAGGLGIWAVTSLTASLLLLVPLFLAIIWAAAIGVTAGKAGLDRL